MRACPASSPATERSFGPLRRADRVPLRGALAAALLLAVAWGGPLGAGELEGGFTICPPPGGLAISVWTGPHDTATGDAVATCEAVAVATVSTLDPISQSWRSFVAGAPATMNTLRALAHGQPVVLRGGEAMATAPPAVQRATLRPPGSLLPSDAEAAARVSRHGVEHRQRNATMNQTVPASVRIPGYVRADGGTDDRARALADRVSGNFTGTTDEILQWGAHKWGFDEDFVRALAAIESWWEQTTEGDYGTSHEHCAAVGQQAPCYESYGVLQVRPPYHPGTWPDAATSTAFNVDYALMFIRVAYEGYLTWLHDLGFDDYRAGDEWGAAGVWVSGRWYTERAREYIDQLRHWYETRPWTEQWFLGNE